MRPSSASVVSAVTGTLFKSVGMRPPGFKGTGARGLLEVWRRPRLGPGLPAADGDSDHRGYPSPAARNCPWLRESAPGECLPDEFAPQPPSSLMTTSALR